jgi:hypothetical protein
MDVSTAEKFIQMSSVMMNAANRGSVLKFSYGDY